MRRINRKLGILILLVFSFSWKIHLCLAEVVWSDDFDDGNYHGWTINAGQLSVEGGSLHSVLDEVDSFNWQMLSGAYRSSTVSYGTWSFDFLMEGNLPEVAVDFIALGTWKWEMGEEETLNYGFYVGGYYPGKVELYKNLKYPASTVLKLENSPFGDMSNDWHHVDITRGEDGRICIYIDDILVIDKMDNAYKESKYFSVHLQHFDSSTSFIDNIVVSDTVDIEPPPKKENSGIPGFPLESVLVSIIAGVLILFKMQRRN